MVRIWFLEDEPADVELVRHELSQGGLHFELRQITSESDFRAGLNGQPPDVILSDRGLPGFDGFAALATARAKDPDVPFIFVTGSQGEEAAIHAFECGASDFVLKHRLSFLTPAVRRALALTGERAHHQAIEEMLHHCQQEMSRRNADLEARVAQRTAELQAANQELEAFSYSVSHDLRAPLRHIEGFIELLEHQAAGQLDSTSQEYLRVIRESSREMGRLMEALLTLSRTTRTPLQKRAINTRELVDKVLGDLRLDAGERRIEWVIGPLPEVQADPSLLRQVWFNLLANAVKFTHGREVARIEAGAQSAPNEVVFYVRDNGAGFDMQYAERLFGVFQRLHNASDFEGTGVGLAIVRRIIQRHGGRVWAEGRPNSGATFYFSLPAGKTSDFA